jgi:uncharacterized protein YdaU (DUF1376 family)
VNFYDFHIGDYASRTAHLEPMEDLAYRRMLDLYYVREVPLPLDPSEICRLVRMRGMEAVIQTILAEFFTKAEAGWSHDKCERVIASAQEKRAKAQASAAQRWGKDANAMPTHSERIAAIKQAASEGNAPIPTTQSHSQKKPPKPPKGGEPEGFGEFYAAYPKKQGRESAAKAFGKVSVSLTVLLEALSWQSEQESWTKDGGKFVPMAATWLNGKRWEDQRPMVDGEPDWRQSRSGVEKRAKQLGIPPWDENEQWPLYLRRVVAADRGEAGEGFSLERLAAMAQQRKAA